MPSLLAKCSICNHFISQYVGPVYTNTVYLRGNWMCRASVILIKLNMELYVKDAVWAWMAECQNKFSLWSSF